ncbi:MAG: dockerin type I domain-containing protein [Planctomycetota bacterium]|nr:dockerin type I domain-containing protein [Planctomycetota bacterium]
MSSTLFGQWSGDASNLLICGASGEQAQSKVATLEDGSSYISWFDNRSGGYDLYMQYLDASGQAMWDEGGELIASRSFSWTMDYDLTIDGDDNAIVAYRNSGLGGDSIFVSSVSQSGVVDWTTNVGIGNQFAGPPQLCMSGGNVFVGWVDNGYSGLQKLDSDGNQVWKTSKTLYDPDGGSYSLTDLKPSDNGSVIASFVQYLFFSGAKQIRSMKINSDGSDAWGGQVSVMNSNSLQFGNYPEFISDGSGGVLYSWYGTSPLQVFAAHVNVDGTLIYEVQVATGGLGVERVNPQSTRDGDEHIVFFNTLTNSQGNSGVSAQRLSSDGTRQWGTTGKSIQSPSNSPQRYVGAAATIGGNATVFYQSVASFGQDLIFASSLNAKGEFVWESDSIEVSSVQSEKDDLSVGVGAGGYILAWDDARNGSPDIYAQRVNADGSLGEGLGEPCFGDINGDGSVSVTDLLEIIAAWGNCSEDCSADLDEDGTVGVTDLLELIAAWGDCA